MLALNNVSLRRGVKLVLDGASVVLQPGEKVGLVGRNGAGKSSLFSLLTHRLQSDAGDVAMPPRWRIGEVAQEMPETDQGATEFVLEGDTRLMEAQAQLVQAELDDDGHAMAEAHHAISDAGGFEARPRAQAMLLGLGFKTSELDSPVNSFSGGWRMRLQLARALMCPADLMLLDEPTNHLDLDALVWLEAWLKRFEGTMIVISHDREFLDAITNVTLHLDATKLTRYTGNYTAFEEMRAERMMQAQANFAKQQERMAHLQKFIDRFKAKASKAKQAQSRVKALARMEKLGPVLTSADFQFEFREPLSLPNPMLAFSMMACGYRADDGSETRIIDGINRSVLAGQRIGILGANGQGKSTLVKTIVGDLPLLAGEVTEGKGLSIGYFAQQELDVLSLDDGALMHMIRLARDKGPAGREQELRDFLGSFRFVGEMVSQPVGTLSGGEKARLVLAMLVWQRPNLLLMDEPTNHLDLTTREALSMALNEFEGTVMLVSHDRALLREVCDEFWLVTAGGVQPFDGDLDDYQKWLLEQSREAAREQSKGDKKRKRDAVAPAPAPAPVAAPSVAAATGGHDRKTGAAQRQQRSDELKPLRKELNAVDNRLGVLMSDRDAAEAALAAPTLTPAQRAEQGKRLKQIGDEIETLEARWLELSTRVDALAAQPAG
ncbi:ABC-F family ATP-binding cassette domain-containing protein [Rhizobacter sp. Root404]|uniref:ABC-F family ATP-binding cassette domain-containing protein n=1 Tax=Rhizobacter sp. Root404 TaxID=1736528 RepID=UPI0006F83180|nr:ATP-binding cassette domain-containing protein [Rhizobacter sp. Root404]KQW36978.1 ABC transporter [Rhizobacter sp. Root404]